MDEKRVSAEWRMPKEMWERIEPLLPRVRRNPKGGRPWIDNRRIADGIFYVLRTGCQWKAVPPEFGSGSTLHRRFQQWVRRGVFRKLWQAGLFEYDQLKGIQWEWQALDGAMTKAPLGGEKMRQKPDGSGEKRYQAFLAHRRRWRTTRPRGGRGQSA
jgi:putative transposase